MVLPVSQANAVKVYNISGYSQGSLPEWLIRKNKKLLKKDADWSKRVELLQDFEFPEASLRIKFTPDERYIIATGVYKPQMRVYDLEEKAMKFDRHTKAQNVEFLVLSDDWQKTVHLQADRSIEFHSQFGLHYSTRIPKFGRDMAYHTPTCDLLVAAASNEVYRLNLDLGRFMKPMETELPAVNCLKINQDHQLFAFGGENGQVEFWDSRNSKRFLSRINIDSLIGQQCEVTSMLFIDALHMAIGTSTGQILLFDLRSSKPLFQKDHNYGYPIKKLEHHYTSQSIFSADTKIVKIWDRQSGKAITSIEPPGDINDMCVQQNTGFLMLAAETSQIQSYFLPSLGPAPKWCSFVENLTEELEESKAQQVYDNYKFLTKDELFRLGLDHLLGTKVLKAYMHGFFIDFRLYEKAKAISNPFAYEEFKKKQNQKKLDEMAQSRISAALPKVNRQLAKQLMKAEDSSDKPDRQSFSLLKDARFKELFENPDFEILVDSEEWKKAHPSGSSRKVVESDLENDDISIKSDDSSSIDEDE